MGVDALESEPDSVVVTEREDVAVMTPEVGATGLPGDTLAPAATAVADSVAEFDGDAVRLIVRDAVAEPGNVPVTLAPEDGDQVRAPLADAPKTPVGVGVTVGDAVGLLVTEED